MSSRGLKLTPCTGIKKKQRRTRAGRFLCASASRQGALASNGRRPHFSVGNQAAAMNVMSIQSILCTWYQNIQEQCYSLL